LVAISKMESDGTAGGVWGEECRAVLLLVFWGGVRGKFSNTLEFMSKNARVSLIYFMASKNLTNAKRVKNDEFYTRKRLWLVRF
jgi:hypothetical protein